MDSQQQVGYSGGGGGGGWGRGDSVFSSVSRVNRLFILHLHCYCVVVLTCYVHFCLFLSVVLALRKACKALLSLLRHAWQPEVECLPYDPFQDFFI